MILTSVLLITIGLHVLFWLIFMNKGQSKNVKNFIENKYKKNWGTMEALEVLGIHQLAEFDRKNKYIYLVVMIKNGRLAHSLSEVTITKKSMLHRRLNEIEKDRFFKSNSVHQQNFSKFMKLYEIY